MRTLLPLLLLSILILPRTYSQDITSLSRDGLYNDIFSYRDSIIADHIDPFAHVSKHEFNKAVDDLPGYAGGLSADELFVRFLKINAMIGDEHTAAEYEETSVFPIGCFWFDEGIMLTKTDTAHHDLLFSRIIAVDKRPIAAVMDSLSQLLSCQDQGFFIEHAPNFLKSPVVLKGMHLIASRDSISVTLVKQNNDTVTTVFRARNIRHINFTKFHPEHMALRYSHRPPYWYMVDTVHRQIYFQILKCVENPKLSMSDLSGMLFKDATAYGIKKIVIDFRDNTGGDSPIMGPFIEQFLGSKFDAAGGVYVLIGRNTVSSGIQNVMDIKDAMQVTTVGESTGGSVNHLGEMKTFVLPYTHLTITYSTKRFVRDKLHGGPLVPDIAIRERMADFINGTDAALDYVEHH